MFIGKLIMKNKSINKNNIIMSNKESILNVQGLAREE